MEAKTFNTFFDPMFTEVKSKYECFFAFGEKQVLEQMKKKELYIHYGYGLYVPKKNVKPFAKELEEIIDIAVKKDIDCNGAEKIIEREIYDHECTYTGDISSAILALAKYPFSEEMILTKFVELMKLE